MRVRALRMGYYGHQRRREGKEFELLDISHYSHRWMEAVNFEPPPEKGPRIPFLGQHIPTVKENEKEKVALNKALKPTGEQSVI